MKRDSHGMTEENWGRLAKVAADAGCASWRVMLRRIAAGELIVAPKLHFSAVTVESGEDEPIVPRGTVNVLREPEQVTLQRHAEARRPLASRRAGAPPILRPSQSKR